MKLQVYFFKRAFCICNGILLGTNITDLLSSLREAKKMNFWLWFDYLKFIIGIQVDGEL